MQCAADYVFKALADPTRRELFERLTRDGEQTVHALTDRAGVSQPMGSKHLAALKRARLVNNRRSGRETHYSARTQALVRSSTGCVSMVRWHGISIGRSLLGSDRWD